MSVDNPAISPSPVATPPETSAIGRLAGVLFAPGETFADIARKPTILVPLVLFLVLGYIGSAVMIPRMDWDSVTAAQAEQIRKQRPNMTDADLEQAGKVAKAIGTVTGYIAPLLGVIWYLIIALVLMGAMRLMGGQGTFKQAFSATLYAWIPLVLFSIILTIVILARGTVDPMTMATTVKSNPAFLVDLKEQPVLFSFLTSFDLFTIWTIVLLIYGFSALSKLSWAKTAAIVVSLWLVMVLMKVGFAAMTAAQSRA